MTEKIRKKLIIYSVILLLIIELLIASIVIVSTFNKESRNEALTLNQQYIFEQANEINSAITLEEKPEDSLWTSIIDDGTLNSDADPNYKSKFYQLKITNNTKNALTSYKVKIEVDDLMYVFNCWCGKIEFHQFVDGKEIVETLDLRKKPKVTNLSLKYYIHDPDDATNYSIPMKKGDYMYYIPSETEGYELPLDVTESTTPEMIVYESIYKDSPKYTTTSYLGNCVLSRNNNKSNPLDMNLSITPRSDSWMKTVGDIQYVAETYDFTFENISKHKISTYTLKYTADKTVYLSSGWNGAFEIHQNGKTALINDLRKLSADNSELSYYEIDGEITIPLYKDDYFIYYPSEDWLETPLSIKTKATPGVIIYHDSEDVISSFETEIDYKLEKKVGKDPLFIISIILLTIYVIAATTEIILATRVKKYEQKAKHDESIIIESINTFVGFIDAKDAYTNGHSIRVALYSKLLAKKMGYSEENQKRIYYIGLMHDCGKIGIPDNILTKPEKLNAEEMKVIRTHTTIGYEILKDFNSIEGIREGILNHHERYDGSGYPNNVSGENIPIDARIICVADAFDAMNSDRCYRPRLTKKEILEEFNNCKGTQFDPKICQHMIDMIESGEVKCESNE